MPKALSVHVHSQGLFHSGPGMHLDARIVRIYSEGQAKRAFLDACIERLCTLRLRLQPRVGGAPLNTSCGP